MSFLGSFLLICAGAGALLPSRWGFRVWVLLALPLGTALVLTPTPQFADRGMLDGLGQVIAVLGLASILAGVGFRWLFGLWMALDRKGTVPLREEETRLLRLFDGVLAGVAGLCAGLVLTLAVALLLRGAPGGLGLHLAVSGLALGLAGWVLRRARGLVRVAAVAALLVLMVLALLGGLVWPARIEARAARIEPDLPRCLRAGDRLAQRGETMLLTLPRGEFGAPGLILTVMGPDGPMHYRWSYRADGFVRFGAYHGGGCPG